MMANKWFSKIVYGSIKISHLHITLVRLIELVLVSFIKRAAVRLDTIRYYTLMVVNTDYLLKAEVLAHDAANQAGISTGE